MTNIAIIVANSRYQQMQQLACCHDDALAVQELLQATEKYAEIEIIEDTTAEELKSRIRDALDKHKDIDELFFYFSGHGAQIEVEFFFCAIDFDARQPNKTGLSSTELHELLRPTNANLVVKVIDACYSGTQLVKSDEIFSPQSKQGFKNLIQIASCLNSQGSLTGTPLSLFTSKFRNAVLSKIDGVVFYTDIIFALRDEFIENNDQTPHFVSQGTGREQFADTAKRFDNIRAKLQTQPSSEQAVALINQEHVATPTLVTMLQSAEPRLATAAGVQKLVGQLFDQIKLKISDEEFAEYFNYEALEHSDYKEPAISGFIIRVLSKEKRPDNFVTATITRERKRNPLTATGAAALFGLGLFGDQGFTEIYDLELNCTMQRAELKITLTPKYSSLKRLVLVVSCAPSLERCYIFEMITQQPLRDFGVFDTEGEEVAREWYKVLWDSSTEAIAQNISQKLLDVARKHLDGTFQRLAPE